MSPLALRGQRLFLILAAVIIVTQVLGVVVALVTSGSEIRWLKSVIQPLGLAVSTAFLWQGDIWLRRLSCLWAVSTGALYVFVSSKIYLTLLGVTPPASTSVLNETFGLPLALLGLLGLAYCITGLLLFFSPAVSAFFIYQRERYA